MSTPSPSPFRRLFRAHLGAVKLHTGVAHDGVEAHSMLALHALLELRVNERGQLVEFEEGPLRLGHAHAHALAARRVAIDVTVLDGIVRTAASVSISLRIDDGPSGTIRLPR